MRFLLHGVLLVTVAAFGVGCERPIRAADVHDRAERLAENARVRRVLCPDVGEQLCLAACPLGRPPREHAECLLRFRFASDPDAFALARALYLASKIVVGVDTSGSIEGYRGEDVEVFPALPVGPERHHLEWVVESVRAFDGFVDAISSRATTPVAFDTRPDAFVFYRTAGPSYPSEYSSEGVIGYNLEGPLNRDPRSAHETLFHELFHLNDERHDFWSDRTLTALFDSIVERCGDDHACFAPYAPYESVVPDGTYYAFDERTRGVREYAAEIGLRYFVEQEAVLRGAAARVPPFKCVTSDNAVAWRRVVDEFFGGVDLTPACDAPEVVEAMQTAQDHGPNGS